VETRFSARVQTGRGPHPASHTEGTGSFPGVKRPGRGGDHPPRLAPTLKNSRAVPLGLRGLFEGELYLYLYLCIAKIFKFGLMDPEECQEGAGKFCIIYTVHTEDMLEIQPDSKHRILFVALKA
jgi:hypothetical protein